MSFAENTQVAVEKTKLELDRLLLKHGATQRGTAHDDERGIAVVFFGLSGRQIRLQVPLPKLEQFKLRAGSSWIVASREDQLRRWEQACRSRWRAMLLITKAKLEFIALGQSSVDRRSVGEFLKSGLDEAYLNGRMPPLLGMGTGDA